MVDRVRIFRRASPDTYASDYFIIGINDLDNRCDMALSKQAKTLTKTQIDTVTATGHDLFHEQIRHPGSQRTLFGTRE